MDKALTAKCITLEMANKMLPLVTPITEDLVSTWKKVERAVSSFDKTKEGAECIFKLTKALTEIIDELEALGCIIESYNKGVVAFLSIVDGEEVLLCWMIGEAEIKHYHRLGQTYEDRLLLTQVLE